MLLALFTVYTLSYLLSGEESKVQKLEAVQTEGCSLLLW